MDHQAACDALEGEIDRFAAVLAGAPMDAAVPSCPEWSVSDLALHLGQVHRWAEHLVRVRASARIPPAEMGLSEGPPDPAWIADGGAELLATLRAVDPATPMWAWGADQHARFWSRRQLHETLVHRFDLELALGAAPHADDAIADDAIDEFLVNLPSAAYFSPNVDRLRGAGERLLLTSAGTGRGWMITLGPEGFRVDPSGPGVPAKASLRGPSVPLLLVLTRRAPLASRGIDVEGDDRLVEHWLAHSALE